MLHELLLALLGYTGDLIIDEREQHKSLGINLSPDAPVSEDRTFKLAPDLSFIHPSERFLNLINRNSSSLLGHTFPFLSTMFGCREKNKVKCFALVTTVAMQNVRFSIFIFLIILFSFRRISQLPNLAQREKKRLNFEKMFWCRMLGVLEMK